jgi:hypothetical protein
MLNLSLLTPNFYPSIAKTHWDTNNPNHLRCNFPSNYSFSLLKTLKVVDSAGVSHSLYMLRDPLESNVNFASFSGKWTHAAFTSDATITKNVLAATTWDPLTSQNFGIFFIEKDEMS